MRQSRAQTREITESHHTDLVLDDGTRISVDSTWIAQVSCAPSGAATDALRFWGTVVLRPERIHISDHRGTRTVVLGPVVPEANDTHD